ncbi:MAG: Mur ligase family protein, partial [Candidatus Nanopelagicales bacterium]
MGESAALARLLARWPENKINPSLNRINQVMQALGNPENSFKSIHIAGTNGKTSTARMVQQLMLELNLRTGLYTSPHLAHPRERIVVDGSAISENEFYELLEKFEPILELVELKLENEKLTFFEAITAMAFMQFSEVPVEVGVIEVGLGGRWDATNLILGEVNLITPISYDHQEYLGNSLSEIAAEKAGILKPEKPAVIAIQASEAEAVIKKRIDELAISAFWQEKDFQILRREMAHGGQIFNLKTPFGVYEDIFINLFGEFQIQNAALAIVAAELFINNKLEDETIHAALEKVTSP